MKELAKPALAWGPVEEEHRVEFLQALTEEANRESPSHSLRANAPTPVTRYGANELNSVQLLGRVMTESNFFHSKLSLAEKLAEKHTLDLKKHGIDTGNMTPMASAHEHAVSGDMMKPIIANYLYICFLFYRLGRQLMEQK